MRPPVGFLMFGYNEAAFDRLVADEKDEISEILQNNYSLWRMMIDEKHQKKGYGKAAVGLAPGFVRTWPCGKAEYCVLPHKPENAAAKKLYASLGFEENGDMEGDEVVAVLKLQEQTYKTGPRAARRFFCFWGDAGEDRFSALEDKGERAQRRVRQNAARA